MKKQILNLGKALNRAEQKEVFGGASIRRYDPYCDEAPEGAAYYGCPCTSNSQCPAGVQYTHVVGGLDEYAFTDGNCSWGTCS